ncbi:MAG: SapC family protein [Cellvibrio sp.]|uniref:SapC family protein n=1 Tax=Cellvibrio sp. TaxID=1965322 RepID=UPI00319F58B4
MANTALLNNVTHHQLKVITRFGAEFGDSISSALVFPTEFIELQKEYPILFRQHPETKKYQATVLLGLSQNENLFLNSSAPSGWAAHYIPATVAKGPFLIGMQHQDSGNSNIPVIHIDMDHLKVNNENGYPLFLEHGGNSPYLEYIANVLKTIHQGIAIQDAMFTLFSELDLIEPIDIDIDLHNGEKRRLLGNFTIHEEKLMELGGDQLERLNKLGFLSLAFAVITSMTNIRRLTDIKKSHK